MQTEERKCFTIKAKIKKSLIKMQKHGERHSWQRPLPANLPDMLGGFCLLQRGPLPANLPDLLGGLGRST